MLVLGAVAGWGYDYNIKLAQTAENNGFDVQFAYWVPNVSGGLVTSDIEQRTMTAARVGKRRG